VKYPTLYRTKQIDGLSIFYREAGPKDAPTLLLLHGLPSSSRMFEPLFARLSDRYHLVAPDYPGFGHSDWPDPKKFAYTFDHYAGIMNHFTEALGLPPEHSTSPHFRIPDDSSPRISSSYSTSTNQVRRTPAGRNNQESHLRQWTSREANPKVRKPESSSHQLTTQILAIPYTQHVHPGSSRHSTQKRKERPPGRPLSRNSGLDTQD
jgi:hypothetical protein